MSGEPVVFVAGHRGMVGSAICRALARRGGCRLLTVDREKLDLTQQAEVRAFFREHSIDQVYLAAAKVGGIHANNSYPADFIYQNLMIEANVIEAAHATGVQRLLFTGSSCIYPRHAEQPIDEAALLSGHLEPTNEPYAIAKIAGIKLCESFNRQHSCDFRSIMPTNLYGPGDNFHPENSHVIPALMHRLHEAHLEQRPEVVVWGSGQARREFMHVDDLAEATLFVMGLPLDRYRSQTSVMVSHLNAGTGEDCSIAELATHLAQVVGYNGRLVWDRSKPDGTPRKCLNVSRLRALGWQASIGLDEGLRQTYAWYRTQTGR
jgi:GDP-L-fucose synthase